MNEEIKKLSIRDLIKNQCEIYYKACETYGAKNFEKIWEMGENSLFNEFANEILDRTTTTYRNILPHNSKLSTDAIEAMENFRDNLEEKMIVDEMDLLLIRYFQKNIEFKKKIIDEFKDKIRKRLDNIPMQDGIPKHDLDKGRWEELNFIINKLN